MNEHADRFSAGQMKAFYREVTKANAMPPQDPKLWRDHGMGLLGGSGKAQNDERTPPSVESRRLGIRSLRRRLSITSCPVLRDGELNHQFNVYHSVLGRP
jgi:hypothetical protein